jgi:cystathionine gamma-synthase
MNDPTRTAPDPKPATRTAQALGHAEFDPADAVAKAVVPPLHVATTYLRDPDNLYRSGYAYGRPDNATVHHAEGVIAALESADDAMLLGSGMAAATAVVLALEPGSHVVAPQVMYWAFKRWLVEAAPRFGIETTLADMSDPSAVRAAIRPGRTRLVWIETPGNPLWTVTDIAAVAAIAHEAGARVAVDSTVATPILSQPLALRADLVMHSASKYLNGNSDVIAGALATAKRDDFWTRIGQVRSQHGAILGPFEAWLLLRGLRTLDVRVKAHSANALTLAGRLARHPAVAEVLYPGLAAHPGHAVAARQMTGGFGGMVSIRVRAGEAAAIAAAANVRLWKRATSLGGVESLIEHRASVEGPGSPCPPDLLRLSVGLEDAGDLYDDLAQALHSAA